MILFRPEAIFASSISKFGTFFPGTDREDFNSYLDFLNPIFQMKNDLTIWENLSNGSSEILLFFCSRTIEFCGNSTSINELMVDGLAANVGTGIVPLFCLSSLVKKVSSVPGACGTDPRSLCVAQE